MEYIIDRAHWKLSGVYVIRNKIDTRIYIGSAKFLKQRMNSHFSQLTLNKHTSITLQRFVNKYGIDKLVYEVLEVCETSQRLIKEQEWLDKLLPFGKTGFNTHRQAQRCSEKKLQPYQIEYIRKTNTGRKASEETKAKLRIARAGKKPTLGHKTSEATKLKLSIANKEYHKKIREQNLNSSNEPNNNPSTIVPVTNV